MRDELDKIGNGIHLAADAALETDLAADGIDRGAQRRVGAIFDEFALRQAVQAQPSACGERVMRGNSQDQGLLSQGTDRDPVGKRSERMIDEGKFQLALNDRRRQGADAPVAQPQRDARMETMIALQKTGQMNDAEGLEDADRQLAADQSAHTGDGVTRLLGARQHLPGMRQQGAARLGDFDAARAAHEELGTELSLQCPDGSRQARLGQMDAVRGAREVAFLDHGKEMRKLAQLHGMNSFSDIITQYHRNNPFDSSMSVADIERHDRRSSFMSARAAAISPALVALLALACGAAAANLYYAQPLLPTIAATFGVSIKAAGLLITASQFGYLMGLAFLVPLGDRLERRRLIIIMLLVTAAGLLAAACAPNFALFAAALLLIGTASVAAQIIVPTAAALAGGQGGGKIVGTVMAGLLTGIIASRIISGLVASVAGWRAVFALASLGMIILCVLLRLSLPRMPPEGTAKLSYGALLRTVIVLIRDEPVLRQRMALGAIGMGCFSALWTAIAFLLAEAPYHYGDAGIGLFGFAGLVGALTARYAGTLADKGYAHRTTPAAIIILIVSWGVLAFGRLSIVPLIVGVVTLDLGVQALHISNQNILYALRPEARSRLTTAYMVAYFLGGAVFSAAASLLYALFGWSGVCILGLAAAIMALIVWLMSRSDRSSSHLNERAHHAR